MTVFGNDVHRVLFARVGAWLREEAGCGLTLSTADDLPLTYYLRAPSLIIAVEVFAEGGDDASVRVRTGIARADQVPHPLAKWLLQATMESTLGAFAAVEADPDSYITFDVLLPGRAVSASTLKLAVTRGQEVHEKLTPLLVSLYAVRPFLNSAPQPD